MTIKTDTNKIKEANAHSVLNSQLVDMAFITMFTGMTDKWIYKQVQLGLLPKPIKLGRSSRWLKSEVEEWVNSRIIASRGSDKKRF